MNSTKLQLNNPSRSNIHVLALLSGPEPQRSILEEIIIKLFSTQSKYKVLIVCGRPELGSAFETLSDRIDRVGHLNTEELSTWIQKSHFIICRSGYSTIMDLLTLNRTALLVPTPGQTEQEYLAKYFNQKHWFTTIAQENLNLDNLIASFQIQEKIKLPILDSTKFKQVVKSELVTN